MLAIKSNLILFYNIHKLRRNVISFDTKNLFLSISLNLHLSDLCTIMGILLGIFSLY